MIKGQKHQKDGVVRKQAHGDDLMMRTQVPIATK